MVRGLLRLIILCPNARACGSREEGLTYDGGPKNWWRDNLAWSEREDLGGGSQVPGIPLNRVLKTLVFVERGNFVFVITSGGQEG